MSPVDFWRLQPTEFWWLVEHHTEMGKSQRMYGSMSQAEVEHIYRRAYGANGRGGSAKGRIVAQRR